MAQGGVPSGLVVPVVVLVIVTVPFGDRRGVRGTGGGIRGQGRVRKIRGVRGLLHGERRSRHLRAQHLKVEMTPSRGVRIRVFKVKGFVR